MKEEIFRLLKQEYSHLGLGDALLQARAEMLDALGFVTAENVGDVVAKQKASLEAIQKANDTRVTDAIKKHDEDLKKKSEEAKKKAEEEAAKKKADEDAKKAAEEAKKKAEEAAKEKGLSPELKAYLEEAEKKRALEFENQFKAQQEMYEKSIKELTATVTTLREDSKKAEIEKAKSERQAKILSKAKELGIPQSRIDEGFVIADDADDYTIGAYLGTVKKNIDATRLPQNNRFSLGNGEANAEEVKAAVEGLVG